MRGSRRFPAKIYLYFASTGLAPLKIQHAPAGSLPRHRRGENTGPRRFPRKGNTGGEILARGGGQKPVVGPREVRKRHPEGNVFRRGHAALVEVRVAALCDDENGSDTSPPALFSVHGTVIRVPDVPALRFPCRRGSLSARRAFCCSFRTAREQRHLSRRL